MSLLSEEEIGRRLGGVPGWSLAGSAIVKTYAFGSFAESMRFVNEVARLAEAVDHHPDIDIRYDEVKLSLSTHSAGGLTSRDFGLAERIEAYVRS